MHTQKPPKKSGQWIGFREIWLGEGVQTEGPTYSTAYKDMELMRGREIERELYGAHPIAKSNENPGPDRIRIDPKEKHTQALEQLQGTDDDS